MNRRHFLQSSALTLCYQTIGISALVALSACSKDTATDDSLRLENAKTIYNEDFIKLAVLSEHQEIENSALDSNLIDLNYKVNQQTLKKNAKDDQLIEVENNLYTESEVIVYTLAASTILKYSNSMPKLQKIVTLDGVDFIGGDLREFRAKSGVNECSETCRADTQCNGYTFALPSHSNKQKHNMCWLKKEGFRYKKGDNYISGIKL